MRDSSARYDVFLSHNSVDKPAVEDVARRLLAAGIRPFLDTWHLIPGQPWQEELEQALTDSDCTAVFLGPSGVSPWHNEEMRAALDDAVRRRDDYRIIPVLLPGAALESVSRFLARRSWVDFSVGLDDAEAFSRLVAGIKGEAFEPGAYQLPDEPAPYRGLLRFEAEHARFFFGREREQAELLNLLGQKQFVAVVGASGSGKSSLVRAGLLPKLTGNALPDSSRWRSLLFTPGSQPLRTLASQLTTFVPLADRPRVADELAERLAERSDGLRTAFQALTAAEPGPVMLVIDQFEELFTQCAEGPEHCRVEAEQFIANLADTLQRGDGLIRVLITLRADFLDRCLTFPVLRDLLQGGQYLLGPMLGPALREAIVRPAQEVGAYFEKGLVGMILREVEQEPGALPLLQHALYELWRARRGPWLTIDAYETSGGVPGALERRAQATYEQMSQAQQGIARDIFVQLSASGEGIADTRRRVDRAELYPVGMSRAEVDAVLVALSDERTRLIVISGDSLEIAHEALIREWDALRGWLSENREALLLRDRLDAAASRWMEGDSDQGALLRGRFLDAALEWRQAHPQFATDRRQRFLDASLALRKQEQSAKQRRTRLLTALVTVVVVLLVPALFLSANIWMFYHQQNSEWQRTGFPANSVLSVAVAGQSAESSGFTICIGTADIGVGCSYDLQNWNISQVGLPSSTPAFLRNRDSWLGNLLGSTWSTKIVGIEAIAFDPLDPGRIYASVMNQAGLYTSWNSGASWTPVADGDALAQLTAPTDVSAMAAHGSSLYVLRQTGSSALEPDQRGSLHVSHDKGLTWQQVAGPGYETGTLRDFALVLDGSKQAEVLYAVGEFGLFRSATDGQWQKLLEADEADVPSLIAVSDDVIYLITYNAERKGGAIVRWIPANHALADRWVEFEGIPRSAVHDPDPNSEFPLWLLLQDGRVVSFDRSGRLHNRGHRPGWLWSTGKHLSVFENAGGETLILMGHRDGLLQYCPYGGTAGACQPARQETGTTRTAFRVTGKVK